MKKSYRAILYLLVLVMIVAGILLFVYRDRLLDFLQEQADLAAPAVAPLAFSVSVDALDTSALDSPQFTALTNNVIDFDFDNICYRPAAVGAVITPLTPSVPGETVVGEESEAGEESGISTPIPVHCVKGNSLPFPVREEE
ncbi:MAG: hypothetical protein WC545_03735 [Patescibacteria group bacterium]|jgi:hypothetical protein